MPETTLEQAKRCPKCDKPGEVTKEVPVQGMERGTKVLTIFCRTKLCPWEDTCWLVQVNPDGSVPPPKDHTGEPKQYIGDFGTDFEAKAIIDRLKAQAAAETDPGAEIRRPRL